MATLKKRDILEVDSLSGKELSRLLALSHEMKRYPAKYSEALKGKTLLMFFEKPSLRTRVSFEVGMAQLGGHAMYYDISTSPLGNKKEGIEDTARTISRYVDAATARLFSHEQLIALAKNATVPIINALTDVAHPCQIFADLMTIQERKGNLKGLKFAFVGDGNNNVTHSLMIGCAMTGMHVAVGCPKGKAYEPQPAVLMRARAIAKKANASVIVHHDAAEAVKDADVIYTDTWMSYHIALADKKRREEIFSPFQVNAALMRHAKKDAIFMHCLPATRGAEVTAQVIDGKQSVVFDEAENRLHAQKALLVWLLHS